MRDPDFFLRYLDMMVLGRHQSLGTWIMAFAGTVLVYWTIERLQSVKRLPSLTRLILYVLLFFVLYKLGKYVPKDLL